MTQTAAWAVKEAIVFRMLENDLLAKMHEMLYIEHVTLAGSASEDAFRDELDGAQAKYNTYGRMSLPWLKWTTMKTAAQAYREALERRKDPNHMALLQKMQAELDADAKRISDAVAMELELRKKATEHSKLLKQQQRRRHGGLPRRRPKSSKRR